MEFPRTEIKIPLTENQFHPNNIQIIQLANKIPKNEIRLPPIVNEVPRSKIEAQQLRKSLLMNKNLSNFM